MVTKKKLLEIIANKDLLINDFFASTKELNHTISDLKKISKGFFEEYTHFRNEIATLLGYEIAKIHYLSVEDLVVKVYPDKVVYTHLTNKNFRYEFQDFKDIITYLVAEIKLERNHTKINLMSIDEKGITVQKSNIKEVHTYLREVLGEDK